MASGGPGDSPSPVSWLQSPTGAEGASGGTLPSVAMQQLPITPVLSSDTVVLTPGRQQLAMPLMLPRAMTDANKAMTDASNIAIASSPPPQLISPGRGVPGWSVLDDSCSVASKTTAWTSASKQTGVSTGLTKQLMLGRGFGGARRRRRPDAAQREWGAPSRRKELPMDEPAGSGGDDDQRWAMR
eukprot:gene27441-2977_t